MDFKNISMKYRPIPFWSWNEKLEAEETKRQIKEMYRVGIGGFFMHARGGLQTEYMGEEWFENVGASIDEAKANGMYTWAYDENGWPSGFGGGMVNGLGIEYQQKYLRISKNEPKENVIGKTGEYWAYYEINPFYVDTLDKKVVAEFISSAYQPYYNRYKNEITGFFTDEPQISRNGIPWSFVFEEEYEKRYGKNIIDDIVALFYPVSGDDFGERRGEGECSAYSSEVEITLINNLRNVLGPHHLSEGECYHVCPNSFIKEKCVWNADNPEEKWNDGYCFVETGI